MAAAGNQGYDAYWSFPCYESRVICVGAINKDYLRWQGSNFGQNVNIWAPGEDVEVIGPDGSAYHLNGTSFSAPYVAGILATFYGFEGKKMTPARASELLRLNAEVNLLKGIRKGSHNLLANNGYQKTSGNPKAPYLGAPVWPVFSFDPTTSIAARTAAPTA